MSEEKCKKILLSYISWPWHSVLVLTCGDDEREKPSLDYNSVKKINSDFFPKRQ